MSQTQEPINPLEYITNDPTQKTEIPTQAVHAIIRFLNGIHQNETYYAFNHHYTQNPKIVKGDNDEVEEIKLETVEYPNHTSYFNQEPVIVTTHLGALAQDLSLGLQQVYLQEIEQGKVNKVGTVIAPKNEDIKLT